MILTSILSLKVWSMTSTVLKVWSMTSTVTECVEYDLYCTESVEYKAPSISENSPHLVKT